MKHEVIAARMLQIDEKLSQIKNKKEQFKAYLDKLPKDDPNFSKAKEEYVNNGMGKIAELLNEKAKLAFIANSDEVNAFKSLELEPLLSKDISGEIKSIVNEYEMRYGKDTQASCSLARCVTCIACPEECAGACHGCVHCTPNGVMTLPPGV